MLCISDKQQINRLTSLLMKETDYRSISELQNELHLSRRSVFYWLKQLNGVLDELKLDPVRHLVRGGYFLTKRTKEALSHFDETDDLGQLSSSERRTVITWLLIRHTPGLSLINLSHRFNVSKNTIIKDIKIIRTALPGRLRIENTAAGKVLVGDENAQRKWVYMQIVKRNAFILGDIKKLPHLKHVADALVSLQQQSRNYYSDDSVQTLICYIAWLLDRMNRQGALLTDEHTYQADAIGVWCRQLLKQYATVASGEVVHLRKILLTAQLQSTDGRSPVMKQLLTISRQIVYRFYTISGVEISSERLIRSLATHLLPTYYRIKYRVPYHFPDLSVIMADYSHLMELTRYAVVPFEQFIGESLTDDELGLITAYFGGELRKIPASSRAGSPDVYLVCTSGIGTTRLLLQQLSVRYPDITFSRPMSIKEFHDHLRKKNMPKLIITTTSVETQYHIPTVHVQAILSQYDFHQLDQIFRKIGLLQIHNRNVPAIVRDVLDIVFDYARIEDFNGLTGRLTNYFSSAEKAEVSMTPSAHLSISELIPLNHIEILEHVHDWKEAVNKSFEPLIRHRCIARKYIRKIINLTESKGPYMIIKDQVMLAHATPQDGVNRLAMSMLILHHSTAIVHADEQKKVKVIFCLAPIDRISHVEALSQLLSLLNDDKLYDQLIHAESPRLVHHIFDQIDHRIDQ